MSGPRPLLTRDEMRAADRWTIEELGVPSLVLMETAGRAVAAAVERRFGLAKEIVAVCGTGNNGADGVVAARALAGQGARVRVVHVGAADRRTPDAAHQAAIAERLQLPTLEVHGERDIGRLQAALSRASVILDGLFGVGLDRPIEGWRARVVEAVDAAPAPVVAIDLPSGVDADTGVVDGPAVGAAATITFQFPKRGLLLHPGRARAGEVEVVDIGIPAAALGRVRPCVRTVDPALRARLEAPRAPDVHKGRFGHVLVVAGAPERPGAALLAARAALRTGAGLVTIGSVEATVERVAPVLEELMAVPLGRSALDAAAVAAAWAERDVLLVGPSLAGDAKLGRLLATVLSEATGPAVLDAGALRAIDLDALRGRSGPTVLTPHPGEMAQLLGVDARAVQRDRIAAATDAAARSGSVVILKGASTVVAGPDRRAVVIEAGNPGLATAGTGDVLAGVVAALLAQGFTAFEAAEAGADLHARAGDAAARRVGERGLIASDLLVELGRSGGAS